MRVVIKTVDGEIAVKEDAVYVDLRVLTPAEPLCLAKKAYSKYEVLEILRDTLGDYDLKKDFIESICKVLDRKL